MIVSIHIPKCAGTSLRKSLSGALGKEVFFDYGDRVTDVSFGAVKHRTKRKIDTLQKLMRGEFEDKKIVHGHFYAPKYIDLFPDAAFTTVVRDPRELVVSYWLYLRRTNQSNPLVDMVKDMSCLSEFVEHPYFHNIITKQMRPLSTENISLLGNQNDMPGYCKKLSELLGRRVEPVEENLNPNGRSYSEFYTFFPRIEELNSSDMEIYFKSLSDTR